MNRIRIRAATVLWWVGLAGVTALLHLLGAGVLGPPPLLHPDRILAWWQARGALLATFATARVVLCGVGAYLWIVWTAVGLASWASFPRLLDALSWCRLPGTKAAVRTIAGVSALGAALVAGPSATWAAGTGSTTAAGNTAAPVLRYEGPVGAPMRGAAGSVRPRAAAEPGAPPTVRRTPVPPAPGTSPVAPTSPPPAAPRAGVPVRPAPEAPQVVRPGASHAAHSVRPSTRPAAAAPWTVQPGDDLWSIAEATLFRAWGRVPPEQDLARYWWEVVQKNRAQLPNPADPNLLWPGDVVTIPIPPPIPGGPQS